MSANTKIEWTDRSWNPVRGCSVISAGCHNCYAMKQAHRFSGPGLAYEGLTKLTKAGPQWTGVIRTVDAALLEPLSWRTPQRVFVNSMSDLFHEDVPFEFIDRVFAVMALAPRHTFQVLTKRAARMRTYFESFRDPQAFQRAWNTCAWVDSIGHNADIEKIEPIQRGLQNVWLGVSVEDRNHLYRVDTLKDTPAAVRFVSMEPLLEDLGALMLDGIEWVIVGGESGPGARPFEVAWARRIVRQCQAGRVPVFVKQLGSDPRDAAAERDDMCAREQWPDGWMPTIAGRRVWRPDLTDRKGGDPDEWPADLRVRQFPSAKLSR